MAHSAGAPYALSFANRVPDRIRGDICLLAPWIGGNENGCYKWLKYIPNGILRTVQAADWKIQAWMLGKPPSLAYQGIGYTVASSKTFGVEPILSGQAPLSGGINCDNNHCVYPSTETVRRPSLCSSSFGEYDDLHDFNGHFDSQGSLGTWSTSLHKSDSGIVTERHSKTILRRLKLKAVSTSLPAQAEKPPPWSFRKLKTLRSVGSLKGKSSTPTPLPKIGDLPCPAQLQRSVSTISINNLGLHTTAEKSDSTIYKASKVFDPTSQSILPQNRPSITTGRLPSFSTSSTTSSDVTTRRSDCLQAALGNALLAASHAESAKGTHSDLLQILNRDHRPWGFSYSSYPHKVLVWYGDKDDKITEDAVRWMERTMSEDRCHVKVVKGAHHALMYNSSVVVDVLERIREFW
ncbi:hypothetical protein SERLA73DRAFT_173990 [Serpula lacrymans var. lacrymans S7.3]|uniref:AB hydrolase-1 domain-containing protein n=2 Tax=Serpula lacrymans var. lacrymans TaxID=341189 RepID=F8PGT4_SERL3|nr:hypothetical protein SERLA73DRAFT_173990 [Serpula lacrymans var. lacrymans S7.3]